MTAFLITMAVLALLKVGIFLTKKPGQHTTTYSAGELLMGAVINGCIGGWALYLLVATGSAA